MPVPREAFPVLLVGQRDQLRRCSEELVIAGRVAVVGAEYELESGQVRFIEGLPLPPAR